MPRKSGTVGDFEVFDPDGEYWKRNRSQVWDGKQYVDPVDLFDQFRRELPDPGDGTFVSDEYSKRFEQFYGKRKWSDFLFTSGACGLRRIGSKLLFICPCGGCIISEEAGKIEKIRAGFRRWLFSVKDFFRRLFGG